MPLIPVNPFFCLYGKAVGSSGGSECSSAEKDFKMLKRKRGKSAGVKHLISVRIFLNQCSTADPAAISLIMSKFGRVRG